MTRPAVVDRGYIYQSSDDTDRLGIRKCLQPSTSPPSPSPQKNTPPKKKQNKTKQNKTYNRNAQRANEASVAITPAPPPAPPPGLKEISKNLVAGLLKKHMTDQLSVESSGRSVRRMTQFIYFFQIDPAACFKASVLKYTQSIYP